MQPKLGFVRSLRGVRQEEIMPALLPVVLTAAHLALTAHEVPKLNVAPSCRAAADAAIRQGSRDASACLQDERRARVKLTKQWTTFSRAERVHCRQLTTLGGPPSYVELLTCLQTAKAARKFADDGARNDRVER
jgi:hypothetical protein